MTLQRLTTIQAQTVQVLKNLGSKLNFSELAKLSTGRRALFKGLLPPIATLLTLLISTLILSSAMWLWASAAATAATFFPIYATTFLTVCGMTALNFIFNREIQTVMHSAREVGQNYVFDKENPTDLRKLVEHVRQELNIYFRQVYGDKHVDMPMPRLMTFENHHFQIKVVEGMNPWNSALFFSSHTFNSHETNMNQKDLAALIAMQMAKIYMRRGNSNLIVKMGVDFFSALESVRHNRWGLGILGMLTWPLEFLFLFQRAVRRSHENEAAEIVAKIGRGGDLYHALDVKPCMTLYKKPSMQEARERQLAQQRLPYQGPLKNWIGPIIDWPKQHLELTEDTRDTYLFWVTLTGFVREFGNHIKELWSDSPRSTRLKEHLVKACNVMDVEANNACNRDLYQQLSDAFRYDVIGPNGRGKGQFDKETREVVPKPKGAHGHHHSHATPVAPLYDARVTTHRAPLEIVQGVSHTISSQRRNSFSS